MALCSKLLTIKDLEMKNDSECQTLGARDRKLYDTFMRRTRQMWNNHKNKPGVNWSLNWLRGYVTIAIERLGCFYCKKELTVKTFSLDHKTPDSRNGNSSILNIEICCLSCNLAKGNLTDVEYFALLELLSKWPESIRKNTLARLASGGRFYTR